MANPYRPARELEGHLDRGELDLAIALAKEISRERARPLGLNVVIRFLPLVATQRPDAYDVWALRWLERWCEELRSHASIDEALDVVQGLTEIPIEPDDALQTIKTVSARHSPLWVR